MLVSADMDMGVSPGLKHYLAVISSHETLRDCVMVMKIKYKTHVAVRYVTKRRRLTKPSLTETELRLVQTVNCAFWLQTSAVLYNRNVNIKLKKKIRSVKIIKLDANVTCINIFWILA